MAILIGCSGWSYEDWVRGRKGRMTSAWTAMTIFIPSSSSNPGFQGVNYRVLKGAASHVIAKTCITDMW